MKRVGSLLKRVLAALVLLVILSQAWFLGWVLWWNHVNPGNTSFMSIRLAEIRQGGDWGLRIRVNGGGDCFLDFAFRSAEVPLLSRSEKRH